MKTRFIPTALAVLLLLAVPASAEIWTVDNTGASDLFFTTLQAASNSGNVEDGDTIYVHGSPDSYGSLNSSKQLCWFGTGYYLDDNPNTQARPIPSRVDNVSFSPGSEGSVFTGFSFTSIYVMADDILITRNGGSNGGSDVINLNWPHGYVSNTVILQNYLVCSRDNSNTACIHVGGNHSHATIENNILRTTSGQCRGIIVEGGGGPLTIAYNVISVHDPGNQYALNIRNTTLHSNIINGRIQGDDFTHHHNLTSGEELGDEDGNVPNVNMNEVYVGAEGNSPDGRWQLAEESPALGAGFNETDCGAFGGLNPYILSGIPPIPTITFFSAPGSASGAQGLPIRVVIRSRY